MVLLIIDSLCVSFRGYALLLAVHCSVLKKIFLSLCSFVWCCVVCGGVASYVKQISILKSCFPSSHLRLLTLRTHRAPPVVHLQVT